MEIKYIVAILFLVPTITAIVFFAVKGKLNEKLTTRFLVATIFLALIIINYDVPMKWEAYGLKFEAMENKVDNAKSVADEAIRIAEKVERNLENANLIAEQAKAQAEKFGAIQAINTFRMMEREYMDIDIEISNWEKSKNIKRESETPSKEKDFEDVLKKIVQKYKMPDEVKYKYIERYHLRSVMEKVREEYLPYAKQFRRLNIELPALPKPVKLPRGIDMKYSPQGVDLKYSPQGVVIRRR